MQGDAGKSTESQVVEDLVLLAASGDRRAQDDLFARYWNVIRSAVHARRERLGIQIRLREERDDLEQDVAIHLLRELPKHEWRGRKAFIAWVKRIADAKVIDVQRYHRAAKRDAAAETDAEKPGRPIAGFNRTPESKIDMRRDVDALNAKLDRLDERYAAAVRMSSLGFTHPEIGEVLECTPEAARKLVARGISRLTQM